MRKGFLVSPTTVTKKKRRNPSNGPTQTTRNEQSGDCKPASRTLASNSRHECQHKGTKVKATTESSWKKGFLLKGNNSKKRIDRNNHRSRQATDPNHVKSNTKTDLSLQHPPNPVPTTPIPQKPKSSLSQTSNSTDLLTLEDRYNEEDNMNRVELLNICVEDEKHSDDTNNNTIHVSDTQTGNIDSLFSSLQEEEEEFTIREVSTRFTKDIGQKAHSFQDFGHNKLFVASDSRISNLHEASSTTKDKFNLTGNQDQLISPSEVRNEKVSSQRKPMVVEVVEGPEDRSIGDSNNQLTQSTSSRVSEDGQLNNHVVCTYQDNAGEIPTPSPLLQSDLSLLLSHIRKSQRKKHSNSNKQSSSSSDNAKENKSTQIFIKRYLQRDLIKLSAVANLRLLWDTILESVASHAKKKFDFSVMTMSSQQSPVILLGLSILHSCGIDGWTTLLESVRLDVLLQNDDGKQNDKQLRLKLLGASLLIKIRVHQWINSFSSIKTESIFELPLCQYLLKKVLPYMAQIVCEKAISNKRTILASTAADSVFCILEFTALATLETDSSFIEWSLLYWNAIPHVNTLLEVLQVWETNQYETSSQQEYKDDLHRYSLLSKKECALVVINDWRQCLSKVEKSIHPSQVNDDEIVRISLLNLCHELSGVFTCPHNTPQDNLSMRTRVGGISQTLSSSVSRPKLFFSLLQTALDLVKSPEGNEIGETFNAMIILRMLCAWLREKRCFQFLSNGVNVDCGIQKAIECCWQFLCSKSERCLIFVLAMLNRLWSDTVGLPDDVVKLDDTYGITRSSTIPSSFKSLLHYIDSNNFEQRDRKELDPSQVLICDLIVRCLCVKPKTLLPFFITQHQFSNASIDVLLKLMEKSFLPNQDFGIIPEGLRVDVGLKLIELAKVNTYLQLALHENPQALSTINPDKILSHVIHAIWTPSSSEYLVSVMSSVLSDLLVRWSGTHSEVIIIILLDSLAKEESKSSTLFKYASKWRRRLLQDTSCPENALKLYLIAIAKAMFKDPAKDTPLLLFSALVGDTTDFVDLPIAVSRQKIAVIGLLTLGVEEISRVDNEISDQVTLFSRLSPLLMLRRVPYNYLCLLHDGDDNYTGLLQSIADIVAVKLRIEQNENLLKKSRLIPVQSFEERNLLAQIAPRYLPFMDPKPVQNVSLSISWFNRLCRPIFLDSMHTLNSKDKMIKSQWQQLKISLFIVCHYVPLASEENDTIEECLIITSTLALRILSIQCSEEEDEVFKCQEGCIHFFATCIDSICRRIIKTQEQRQQVNSSLVEEVLTTLETPQKEAVQNDVTASLSKLCSTLLQIACPQIETKSISKANNSFFDSILIQLDISENQWTTSCRICILNAFTVASRLCSLVDGAERVTCLSRLVLQDILHWCYADIIDGECYHPLCVAASFQLTFNILTKTKSFDCLKIYGKSHRDSVQRMFWKCIEVINIQESTVIKGSIETVRLAGLKLLLCILSIEESIRKEDSRMNVECTSNLSSSDITRVVSLLRGIMNIETNLEIRKLATHTLTALQPNL